MEKILSKEDNWRLGFHLMPPVGWMNDPNGLCWYQGEYHVFFQYCPESANNGLSRWGHYVSRDLLNWQFLGIGVEADTPWETDGAYSGCAFVEQDVMHLFYTGNVKQPGDFDYILRGREANTIHAVSRDGRSVEGKECVMRNADYGNRYSCHVRDPKVWKEADTYYMVQGGRTKEGTGEVLLFSSKDLKRWERIHILTDPSLSGYMWECPDLFFLEGSTFLSVSPQGLQQEEFRFQNVYQSGVFSVEGDYRKESRLKNFREWDMGFDFYAPQTFEDGSGRRILLGWMGLPDIPYTNPTVDRGWQHGLTMARELRITKGELTQTPVKEYENLRLQEEAMESGEEKKVTLAEILYENPDSEGFQVSIEEELQLSFEKETGIFTMKFTGDLGQGRTVRKTKIKSCTHVDIWIDTSAVEVYLNHGEQVLTTRYYAASSVVTVKGSYRKGRMKLWRLRAMEVSF